MSFGTTLTPGNCCQQRDQRPLARQHHARAAGDDQRQIAGKLDGVAKALLGVHQDCAALRITAIPLRPRQIDKVAAETIVPLAPFIFAEAEIEISGEQRRDGLVPVRLG